MMWPSWAELFDGDEPIVLRLGVVQSGGTTFLPNVLLRGDTTAQSTPNYVNGYSPSNGQLVLVAVRMPGNKRVCVIGVPQ